jgi:heme iron utilization protein
MTAIDRLGFHLRLKTQDGVKGTRIAFLREVSDPAGDQRSVRRDGKAGPSRISR